MDDIKRIVAGNISLLRQEKKMTQSDLAAQLNYSDKAVSKWERGESLPDVAVLKKIADLFGVTLDYLVEEEHPVAEPEPEEPEAADPAAAADENLKKRSHAVITAISVLLVWLVATMVYFLMDMLLAHAAVCSMIFVYAVPVSMIVWLVFNSIWFNRRRNYMIISLLMWTVLLSIFLSLLPFSVNIWRVFLLGIPGQIIIWLWSRMRIKPTKSGI
ncbi:MAG: helix-turn-helix transcriptional regulator [Clostridia bacterium]|nr:helix-turn-helix transcriptional regulator [Clostridia bacterium]